MADKLVAYSAGQEPSFPANYEVVRRVTLNFTDIVNNNNKYYNLEIQVAKSGESRIFTQYGRVGAPNAAKEYRVTSSQSQANVESDKIIKSKTKKGYVEVELKQASVGSEAGKAIVETTKVSTEDLKKIGIKTQEEVPAEASKLHPEVQDLVRTWFGVTAEFIELNLDTKKCPLGQLSVNQITKAKDILEEARKIVHMTKPDVQELNKLTSSYYSNIPHVLGHRINADLLRLDADAKIDKAFDILDVFGDAKDIATVMTKKSAIDSQYATLNTELEWVDPSSPTWKWLDAMVHETRAGNHSALGKLKTHKIFKVSRKDEFKNFMDTAQEIAKECGKHTPSETYAKLVQKRPDVPKELQELYQKANVAPGWHGTRRANMIGITTKGLLIRPSGVAHAGSMYGDGIYWATNSTKSINYCDVKGSYWAQGTNKTAYLFLGDVAYGNYKMANGSHFYTKKSISPAHSVFAKAGGGVLNDELITYVPTGPGQQHMVKYIIEFETQVK